MSGTQFSAQWGADPSSDIVRLARAYCRGRKMSTLLSVPAHPVINPQGLRVFDFRAEISPGNTDEQVSLSEISEFLQRYFSEYADHKATQPYKFKGDELILQIDNAYAQIDSGEYAPAPLNYYQYVLETRYWTKVTLLDWGTEQSPVSKHLLAKYPKIRLFQGSLPEAWSLLKHAPNVVIGAGVLAQALCLMAPGRKRIWLPEYAKHPDFAPSDKREINPVEVNHYFAPREWWSGNRQREELLAYPPAHLADHTRWKFTETERCRSFEFCQSCRDTGATGKLWRQVIQQRFDVPERDWECPHGWKWGGKPGFLLGLKKTLKLGSVIKKTTTALGVKPCVDCDERGEKLDGNRR